jgi:histidine ammonia-lyase
VPFYAEDRLFAPDIEVARTLVMHGAPGGEQQDLLAALWS